MRSEWKATICLAGLAALMIGEPAVKTAPQSQPSPPTAAPPRRRSSVTAAGPISNEPDQALLSEANQILRQMSSLTGLPIKSQVRYQVVSHAEAQQYMLHNLDSEYTPQEFQIQEAMLKAFGLVPPDFDLRKFLITFYTEQAAGFYDPKTQTMYIARWIPESMQPMVLAHELTHALQDQSFGLEKFLYAERQNDDASAARQALVEGYATAAMLQRMIEPAQLGNFFSVRTLFGPMLAQQIERFPVFSKAPFYFRYSALFPYVEGAGFAQDALRRGGWKTLNSAFNSPPEATEEFFDPQLYFRHEAFPKIELPQPKALKHVKGLSLLERNTLGALGIYTLVGQFISQDEARKLATGWVGDRCLLYEKGNDSGYLIIARTVWNTPGSAGRFFKDTVAMMKEKYPDLEKKASSTQGSFSAATPRGDVMVLLDGDEVRWAEGVPGKKQRALLKFLRSVGSKPTPAHENRVASGKESRVAGVTTSRRPAWRSTSSANRLAQLRSFSDFAKAARLRPAEPALRPRREAGAFAPAPLRWQTRS